MERNRDCSNCLYLGKNYHRTLSGFEVGLPQDYCKIGRRVYVAKPCDDEVNRSDGGATFIDLDDLRDNDNLLGC